MTSDRPFPQGGGPGGAAGSSRAGWRRAVLLALVLAALAAAGVSGAGRYVSTFWTYRGFPPPSTPRSVVVRTASGARRVPVVMPAVQGISVVSKALGGYSDQVQVVLPPGYATHPHQRYPVLYLLHGFPGLPSGFLTIGRVASIEATLVAEGRMKPVIMVMPTGTRSFLADQEWANSTAPANGWETFVARDLVRAIDSRYRTIRSGSARGIAGLSEGGYGALNIGLHHPGEFGLLESWSGYMMAYHASALFSHNARLLSYNSPALWLRSAAPAIRAAHTYVWFYSGTSDPLTPQNLAFAAELTSFGVANHFYTVPGAHSWALWRGQMWQALIVASEHLRHA